MSATDDPYKVMVVDDSAIIRGLLTRALEADPSVRVVASAANGQMAVNALSRTEVEVVVLDIEMPVMDGLTALPRLLERQPGLVVIMASTLTLRNADVSLRALRMGAADYVTKPSSGVGERAGAQAFRSELLAKVKVLAQAARLRGGRRPTAGGAMGGTAAPSVAHAAPDSTRAAAAPGLTAIALRPAPARPPAILAIGSSTGGPQALFRFFTDTRGAITVPVVITQHMPATFTTLLADHLARISGLVCREPDNGESLQPGRVYVAPGGRHMIVDRQGQSVVLRLTEDPPENYCRPSVDPLLRSVAAVYGAGVLTVILTGMGSDGLRGCEAVVAAGGCVVAQDEASSVVWGMPGAVARRGLCSAVLPLPEIAGYVRNQLMRPAA